jgi:hypothetical protein
MTILKYLKLLIMKIKENIIFKILNVSLDYRWSKKKLLIEQNDLRLKANCREVKIDLWQFMEDTKTKKRLRRLRPANKIRKIFSGKKFFQLLLSDIKSLVWKIFWVLKNPFLRRILLRNKRPIQKYKTTSIN